MTGKFLFILFLILIYQTSAAQDHDHDHDHDDHTGTEQEHHHLHEIGVSAAPVYFVKADELSVATHLHYTYYLPNTKFGLGIGYEHIFDEHKHNFIGAEFSYRIIHPLSISLTPGVVFEGEHPDEKDFALHLETAYEFELGAFHVGPAFELAWHSEDYHLSLGLHVGLGL